MNEIDLVRVSLKDFFTKRMLQYAIVPLIITLIIMFALFFTTASYGMDSLSIMITQAQNGQEIVVSHDAPFFIVG